MTHLKLFFLIGLFAFCSAKSVKAQQPTNAANSLRMEAGQELSAAQQAIVTISAFTAQGNMAQLQNALNTGLDAGLTVNELKEILVQLYAYAGFPRSLNALHSFMDVLKARKQQGIIDKPGREPAPLPANKTKRQLGTELQTRLVGVPITGEVYEFAPAIDQFLKEHLFGDIFGRDNLDWKTREIATISALASLSGVENQLRAHFGVGLYNGLTEQQLTQLVSIIQTSVGINEGNAANQVLQTVLKRTPRTKAIVQAATLFLKGEKITNSNFTGNAWLQQLIVSDSLNPTQVGSVTFEPGARTNWHSHPAGQILLITDGIGYYQEQGSPKRIIRKGEVVNCPPNVPHWHGASKDDPLVQVAITNTYKGAVVWLNPVADEEYNK
ncbi:cupin domain-containing protein [Spirosoma taeanense]|uniref:Cupin domain-containing protein n=1 Tax=Spirosoma taeanense TaxID=2735870 RepID=A0A6M5Y9R3_9BACT|nr:carboxymuconolactone decarboxylase family protein [Spirosoma taeanense]QJW89572.1 cupin domain-containing protein [Spirosoma taeanense]